MNVEKLKQLKKDAGYTNQMIADESGVPLGTVQKIFSGETKAPRFKTLKAIEGVLIYASGYDDEIRIATANAAANAAVNAAAGSAVNAAAGPAVNAAAGAPAGGINVALAAQGSEAGLAPDTKEVIRKTSDPIKKTVAGGQQDADSETEMDLGSSAKDDPDSSAKNDFGKDMLKELMTGEIIFAIRSYIEENGVSAYLAGPLTPVRFGGAEQLGEEVYPDVCLVTVREMIKRDGIEGAPKLIIEIMDSETKSMQLGTKPDMYREAGVKEYWMIDITAKNIMAYDFEREAFPSMYGFSGRVPVRTIGGGCEVNFAKLYSKVGFLFDEAD